MTRTLSYSGSLLLFLAIASCPFVRPATADVVVHDWGYAIGFDVNFPGEPTEIFDAATGDVSGWWDHHHSEKPVKLVIEPKPGGHFIEIFDEDGNGAIHADVIIADRGKMLRMHGPLGLTGQAIDFVMTLEFEADGDSTVLHFEGNISGQIDEKTAGVVEDVWRHFLIGRLKPWVEGGQHLTSRPTKP